MPSDLRARHPIVLSVRRRLTLSKPTMRPVIDRQPHTSTRAPCPVSQTATAIQSFVAIAAIVGFIAIGPVAALTALGAPLPPVVAAYCFVTLMVAVFVETQCGVIPLWRFRRQLDALPETAHPLGF